MPVLVSRRSHCSWLCSFSLQACLNWIGWLGWVIYFLGFLVFSLFLVNVFGCYVCMCLIFYGKRSFRRDQAPLFSGT